MNSQSAVIPEEAITALKNGRKIEAIKITRAETGMQLKEANGRDTNGSGASCRLTNGRS